MIRQRLLLAIMIGLMLTVSFSAAEQPSANKSDGARAVLGRTATGATIAFVREGSTWGMEISGGGLPLLKQAKPAQFEVFSKEGEEIRQLASAYSSVTPSAGAIIARAEVSPMKGVAFRLEDRWTLNGAVLNVRRKVEVKGNANGGFYSAVRFETGPEVTWPDVDYLAPGMVYGDPTYDGERSPGGMLNYRAHHFRIREDFLPAPMFALSFRDGSSVTVLDPAPRGNTTLEETKAEAGPVMVNGVFQFGAMGAEESKSGGIEFGYWLPGSVNEYAGPWRGPLVASWRRRYHPIKDGFVQTYPVAFRFGRGESFPELTRSDVRLEWQTLKPALNYHDIEVVRRTLIDHLSERVVTVEGRTGIPFIVSTKTGKVWAVDDQSGTNDPTWWWRAILGFVGKNIESADQLLRESDRDPGPRGQKMRQQGLDIIATFIRMVPMKPAPAGTGFNLLTGKPSMTNPQYNTWFLRAPAEDMRMLMLAYRREKKQGRDHPEWIQWCRDFADWALVQQRADGSFPRGYRPGTGEVVEASGTTSYNVVPLFMILSEETGDSKYKDSAVRAAEYVWQSFGSRGVFIGGAIDNPNITDKEAGLLSMEAFLALYESTKEVKWLKRAEVAGTFAESWIYLWNVPMPEDADNNELHWKKEVPTVGVQGITALVAGHVDEFLDWSVPAYAKLYTYTKDPHYLDVTRILLHNCKAMLSLPGRYYGMMGPGWQQENWRMGSAPHEGRGFGTPEKWMPWVSTNHLYGITALEEFNPQLFKQLCAKPAPAEKGKGR